jgi:hypothetical protein
MGYDFTPIKNETVVVLKDGRVVGTIKRYRAHGGCIVSVPGVMSPSSTPGRAFYKTLKEAKRALLDDME